MIVYLTIPPSLCVVSEKLVTELFLKRKVLNTSDMILDDLTPFKAYDLSVLFLKPKHLKIIYSKFLKYRMYNMKKRLNLDKVSSVFCIFALILLQVKHIW